MSLIIRYTFVLISIYFILGAIYGATLNFFWSLIVGSIILIYGIVYNLREEYRK